MKITFPQLSPKRNIAEFSTATVSSKKQSVRGVFIRTKETVSPQKINSILILKFINNPKFKQQLSDCIQNNFVKEALKESEKKLYKLCVTWQNLVSKVDFYFFEDIFLIID